MGIEAQILDTLNLKPEMLSQGLWKFRTPNQSSQEQWIPPQPGFLKLNYDGASKGNPRQAGAGGLFRNSQGTLCRFSAFDLGHATNNEEELMAVKQGLLIAIRESYQRIIVEGDSALVIEMLKKI